MTSKFAAKLVVALACGFPLAFVFATGACRSSSQPPAQVASDPSLGGELGAAVHARVAGEVTKQELVALSIAIADDGRIVHVEHFGFEDRERGVPCTSRTLYRWASISKPLTAVVAMQLANEGKLDLDADVRTYVPSFPAKPWPITARELLCHQGGIVHYSNGTVIAAPPRAGLEHPFFDAIDALAKFAPSPLVAEPGTKFSYSTHGYVLLGAVLQCAAHEPYPELVHERIANPLGMTTLQPDYAWIPIAHRATGFKKDANGHAVPSDDVDVSWKLPGGGFVSNVLDLSRFSIGLLECTVVDRETRGRLWTRQRTKDGAETSYGLGFEVDSRKGRREIHHSGAQEKTRTYLLMLPEEHASVALMTNSEWAQLAPLARDVVDLWIAEHGTVR